MLRKLLFGGNHDSNPGVAALRVFAGGAMLTHGWPKLFGGGLQGFTAYVGSLGVPLPTVMAFLAAFSESVGAILLMVGLLTRPAATMLAATMAVAAFGAHGADPFAKQELALLYLFIMLLFVLKGAGTWSIDRLARG
jgi:putative oxidoreductase